MLNVADEELLLVGMEIEVPNLSLDDGVLSHDVLVVFVVFATLDILAVY